VKDVSKMADASLRRSATLTGAHLVKSGHDNEALLVRGMAAEIVRLRAVERDFAQHIKEEAGR
jgi:hypothetical protein